MSNVITYQTYDENADEIAFWYKPEDDLIVIDYGDDNAGGSIDVEATTFLKIASMLEKDRNRTLGTAKATVHIKGVD